MHKEQWTNELKPFAILLSGVNDDLENRDDAELLVLLDACQQPTTTNCWCWTYEAAKWLRTLVDAELARRSYAAAHR